MRSPITVTACQPFFLGGNAFHIRFAVTSLYDAAAFNLFFLLPVNIDSKLKARVDFPLPYGPVHVYAP